MISRLSFAFAGILGVWVAAASPLFAETQVGDQQGEPIVKVVSRAQGDGPVRSGLDVLEAEKFRRLRGKRVAVLTNHSAINKSGVHLVDLLVGSKQVTLVKFFSPEHGLYGNVDTKTPDTTEPRTGLMVHSLYTSSKRKRAHAPDPETLNGVDVVLVDMQDIGARFYTYCGYMGKMMEECAKKGVEVMVLDRPNPIGGEYVGGPMLDSDLVGNITGYFPMPVAHGMTMGELARMFNAELKIGCKLTVVEMTGYERRMFWDETGMRWVNPSPNIQDLDAAIGYVGTAMTESVFSMGRGTTEPFHIFGAPWVTDAQEFADAMTSAGLPGVRFEPVEFTPTGTLSKGHVGENKLCRGARFIITDRRKFRACDMGVHLMTVLQEKYGTAKTGEAMPPYNIIRTRGSNSAVLVARIVEKKPAKETMEWMAKTTEPFLKTRAKYLIYK